MSKKLVSEQYQMKCIDDDYEVHGDFNTYSARNLMIVFEICDSKERACKDDETIKKALSFSYILLLENEELYHHHKEPESDEMIHRGTKASWYALSTVTRSDFQKKISVEQLHYDRRNIFGFT